MQYIIYILQLILKILTLFSANTEEIHEKFKVHLNVEEYIRIPPDMLFILFLLIKKA